jgi:hypothetical protein
MAALGTMMTMTRMTTTTTIATLAWMTEGAARVGLVCSGSRALTMTPASGRAAWNHLRATSERDDRIGRLPARRYRPRCTRILRSGTCYCGNSDVNGSTDHL